MLQIKGRVHIGESWPNYVENWKLNLLNGFKVVHWGGATSWLGGPWPLQKKKKNSH